MVSDITDSPLGLWYINQSKFKIMKTKNTLFIQPFFMLLILFFTVNVWGQEEEEPVPTEDKCWCKDTELISDGTMMVVNNIDSLVANDSGDIWWKDLKGCDGENCEEEECTYKKKICRWVWVPVGDAGTEPLEGGDTTQVDEEDSVRVKICEFETFEAKCTSETFLEDLPWDTTGMESGDCNCIALNNRNNLAYYINVTERINNGDTLTYRPVEGGDCDVDCKSTCSFQKLNRRTNKWEDKEGFCTRYWPSGGGDRRNTVASLLKGEQKSIGFYPNPARTRIQIIGGSEPSTYIYTLAGELVLRSKTKCIDISPLNNGVYVIILSDGERVKREKLVISR